MMSECMCGHDSDRYCDICGQPLCDDCDFGEHTDECSICVECKEEQREQRRVENEKRWADINEDLQFIRDNHIKFSANLTVTMFAAVADTINWSVSHVCSPVVGMSNQTYRRGKELLLKNIDEVKRIIKASLKDND